MLRVICAALVLGLTLPAAAAANDVSRKLTETFDQARQRHSAERWNRYEQNGRQAPLGGYDSRLGDPAPYGTERPGYNTPQPYGAGRSFYYDDEY